MEKAAVEQYRTGQEFPVEQGRGLGQGVEIAGMVVRGAQVRCGLGLRKIPQGLTWVGER